MQNFIANIIVPSRDCQLKANDELYQFFCLYTVFIGSSFMQKSPFFIDVEWIPGVSGAPGGLPGASGHQKSYKELEHFKEN